MSSFKGPKEEITKLAEEYDLNVDEAQHVKEIMDEEGVDADDAVELKDDL